MFLAQIKKILGQPIPATPRPNSASIAKNRLLNSIRADRDHVEDALKPIHDLAASFAAQAEDLLNLPGGSIHARIDHNGTHATVNYRIPFAHPPE